MSLIERDALLKNIQIWKDSCQTFEMKILIDAIIKFVNEFKTVDAVPVVHGHWIVDTCDESVQCSNCHNWLSFDGIGSLEDYDVIEDLELNYCQYCGAKMDEVSE